MQSNYSVIGMIYACAIALTMPVHRKAICRLARQCSVFFLLFVWVWTILNFLFCNVGGKS